MDFKILDRKEIEGKSWLLCKGNLLDYISTLKRDFSEFQIQRRIVKNGYLDTLLKTIIDGEPMPTITLTCSTYSLLEKDSIRIDSNNIEILDGLQRSFRIWAFWMLSNLVQDEGISDYKELTIKLKTPEYEYIKRLDFINSSYLKKILDVEYRSIVLDAYSKYSLVFVIWTGLSDQDVVEKMLVLNAGQRPVSSTHQFEILFLHYFDKDKLHYDKKIRLLRERDAEYYKCKHGERNIGEYALTSVIIAIQSYLQAKPLRIASANKLMLEDEAVGDVRNYRYFFSGDSLSGFINLVYQLDRQLCSSDEIYRTWYGKDTTLSGVFAAFGNMFSEEERTVNNLEMAINKLFSNSFDFEINEYSKAYSELSSVRINVGQKVREAIFRYTYAMLSENRITWSEAFNRNFYDNEYASVPLF